MDGVNVDTYIYVPTFYFKERIMKCVECGFKVFRGRCASCGFWQLECNCGTVFAAKRRSKQTCSDKCRKSKERVTFRKRVIVTPSDTIQLRQTPILPGLIVTGTKCQKCEARMCDERVIHHWPECESYNKDDDNKCLISLMR